MIPKTEIKIIQMKLKMANKLRKKKTNYNKYNSQKKYKSLKNRKK